MKIWKLVKILIFMLIFISNVNAREQVRIVGSSTIYPFSSTVAEELGATTKYSTPIVESTGSGGGMKLFCAGNGLNTPDITNSSRQIKSSELEVCHQNNVKDITEVKIGFDGIVFVHSQKAKNQNMKLTIKQLMLAVAKEVPNNQGDNTGNKLIKNPYKKWSDIDPTLPNQKIVIYGPPKSSGTRDAFEDMVLKHQSKKMSVYTDVYKKTNNKRYKAYKLIRTDGAYIPSGENDNLIVAKLNKNKTAFGIFGYSFLMENEDSLKSISIDGISPTPSSISDGTYPISRTLFFYTKNSHFKSLPAMEQYVKMFLSEDMLGDEGILGELGLISLPQDIRSTIRDDVKTRVNVKF